MTEATAENEGKDTPAWRRVWQKCSDAGRWAVAVFQGHSGAKQLKDRKE